MVSRTQLSQKSGIANLLARKKASSKSYLATVPTTTAVQPVQVSQADIEAQKKYEAELSAYNAAKHQEALYKMAYKLIATGRERAARGDPELTPIINKIKAFAQAAAQDLAHYSSISAPTTITIGSSPSTSISLGTPSQKNVYDVATGTYTDSSGNKMSVATAPKGATVVDTRLTTKISTPIISVPTLSAESQRYQTLGYTKSQSEKLAVESVKQGGMTFTPNKAKEIIKEKTTVGEKIKNVYLASNPLALGSSSSVKTISKARDTADKVREAEKIVDKMDRLGEELTFIESYQIDKTTGEWTGNEKDLESYNKKIEEYEKELEKYKKMGAVVDEEGNIIEPTVTVGYFGLTKEKPLSEYKGLTSFWKALPTQIDIIGSEVSATIGKAVELTGITEPSREIKYEYSTTRPTILTLSGETQTYTSPTRQVNPLTGEKNLFIDVEGTYKTKGTTSKEFGEQIYKGGSTITSVGKYAIPIAGQVFFAQETIGTVQESGGIKKYIKEKPGEAALTGGIILTGGLLSGGKYLTKIRPTAIEGGIKYSTRAQDWLGTRLRVSKEGVKVLPSEKYQFKIFREELVPSEAREFLAKIPRSQRQEEAFGKTITYYDDITGTARQVRTGSKAIVETPQGVLYEGVPYGKLGRQQREDVLKFLEDKGYTKKQISEMLRLQQPVVTEYGFLGSERIIQEGGKEAVLLKGELREKPISIMTKGIPSRLGTGRTTFLEVAGKPIEGGKEGTQFLKFSEVSRKTYLTKQGYPYSKLSQAGKTKEIREGITGAKEITIQDLPSVSGKFVKRKKGEYALELEGAQFELLGDKQYKIFKELSLSKKVVPSSRQLEISKGKVLVEEGEPLLKVTRDEELIPIQVPKKEVELFHGTTKARAEEIRKAGFTGEGISFTTSKEFAESFARRRKMYDAFKGIKTEPEVISIKLPKEKFIEYKQTTQSKLYDEVVVDRNIVTQLITKPQTRQVSKEVLSSPLLTIQKRIPTIKQPKIKEIPALEIKQKEVPSIVSAGGLTTDKYQTEELTVIKLEPIIDKTKVEEVQVQSEVIKPKQVSFFGERTKERETQKPVLNLQFREPQKESPKEIVTIKETQPQKQLFRQLTVQEQATKLLDVLKTKQTTKETFKPITPITPKIKVPIKIKTPLLKRLSKKAEGGDLFKVFVTKKGKDIQLEDMFGTLGEARKVLAKELSTTLRAGGGILKGEKKLSFKEIGLFGEEFRPSKVSEFKVIQRKERRLKKGGQEAREIQFFR